MVKRVGKIFARIPLAEPKVNDEPEKRDIEKLWDVELYLNNEVAVEVYRKFGVSIRIHL